MTIFNSLATLLILLPLAVASVAEAGTARKADLIIVYKQQRILKLMRGGHLVRQYPIALGQPARTQAAGGRWADPRRHLPDRLAQ